ncbi:MAG: hypothetical protein IJN56_01875 [Clostridia bacterium]|nr:hypothetical protein [Clostridia bacterium]
MKKILCILLTLLIFVGLCACGSDADTSSDVKVIYEEEVVYEGGIPVSSDTSLKDDTGTQTDTSSVQSETSSVSSVSPEQQQPQENICSLNDAVILQNIKLNGRCEKSNNGINLNMAASAIEFNTDSSSVLLTVEASAGVYYTVMVDGEITAQHQAIESSNASYIVVARGLENGSHNIKFIRDSESRENMNFTVVSIQLDDGAKLLPKDSDKTVIEFLGDSLTSGYGNLVLNGVADPSALKNQSSTKAYPFLVANELGCDYRIVSMSGIALGKREGYPTFPEFYSLESYHLDKAKKYASSNPAVVDIVVVNLGTNDVGARLYDAGNFESVSAYEQHFADLITNIGYPKDAKIIFLYGVWNNEPITAINGAVKKLNSLGYNNVYTLQLPVCKSGGGSHPSDKEHREIADKVIEFFKDKAIT